MQRVVHRGCDSNALEMRFIRGNPYDGCVCDDTALPSAPESHILAARIANKGGTTMTSQPIAALAAAGIAALLGAQAIAQTTTGTVDSHVAAAKAAAGTEHTALFESTCRPAPGPPPAATGPRQVPERATWHYDPVKVFDNLYYIGEKEYSAWAVVTSAGIIVVDTIWAHSVEDEIVGGLKKLGFDPANIKYAIVSHAHIDHIGGAKFLQDTYGTRIVMSAADWDFAEQSPRLPAEIKPKRDIVATDGQKLTLGDTTLSLYLTPGHTPGTISMLIPVKDGGQPHLVATWGGTGFNFELKEATFQTYINSAVKYGPIVAQSGADVLLSNHTIFDGSRTRLPAMATRKPGEPHPYVIGNDSVQRYVKVAEECARANLLRLK
jgi:metallo-beta-lactamase class B